MKTIKNLSLVLFCFVGLLFCSQSVVAQDMSAKEYKEMIKERKKIAKLTRKQVEANTSKEAKKMAKQMKKEGWKPMPGTPTLETQCNDLFMRRYEQGADFPRYITGNGQAFGNTAGVAKKVAEQRAKSALASNISSELVALVEEGTSNVEYSATDQETISKFVDSNMTKLQQSLGRTEVVLQAYREAKGESANSIEVVVYVSYDGSRARQDLLKMFEEDHKDMYSDLKKMLNVK